MPSAVDLENADPENRVVESLVIENLRLSSELLMPQIYQLIAQGNVRRIIITNEEGHALLRLPTAAPDINGMMAAVLSSEVAAINVISAIVPNPRMVVERVSR
ncbi:MAG: DUF4342 domain-containing protein [Cyanobacteria bacterium J06606_4]